ncbi:hypothetical protein AB1Y20_016505 [Prymnesium parvum]|uniref:Uncharacterized protein n=1 Tax=Prymnesium parvum TaxID=97485 RepID=A0AB34ICU1_PRYPA
MATCHSEATARGRPRVLATIASILASMASSRALPSSACSTAPWNSWQLRRDPHAAHAPSACTIGSASSAGKHEARAGACASTRNSHSASERNRSSCQRGGEAEEREAEGVRSAADERLGRRKYSRRRRALAGAAER